MLRLCINITKVTFLETDFSQNAITIAFYGDCPLFSLLLLFFNFGQSTVMI